MESGMEEGMEGRMEERMEEEMEGGMKGGMEGGMKGGMEEGVASRNLSANVGMAVPRGVNHTVGALGQGWCRVVAGLALVLAGTVLGGFAPAHGFAWQLCRTAWLLSSWLGPSTRFGPALGHPAPHSPLSATSQLSQFCFWSRGGARPGGAGEGQFYKDSSGLA